MFSMLGPLESFSGTELGLVLTEPCGQWWIYQNGDDPGLAESRKNTGREFRSKLESVHAESTEAEGGGGRASWTSGRWK